MKTSGGNSLKNISKISKVFAAVVLSQYLACSPAQTGSGNEIIDVQPEMQELCSYEITVPENITVSFYESQRYCAPHCQLFHRIEFSSDEPCDRNRPTRTEVYRAEALPLQTDFVTDDTYGLSNRDDDPDECIDREVICAWRADETVF